MATELNAVRIIRNGVMEQGQAEVAQDLTADTNAKLPSVQVIADLTLGYAAIQNNVPVIREILVTNDGETTLSDIELVVKCVPAFAEGARFRFEALAPGESRRLAPVDLRPDHRYFSQLDESERAIITASLRVREAELITATHNIDVLAYDQWAGTRALPELLAAFCMPNSRVVDKLLARASGLLRQTSADLSMDGYQSKNREKVWKQVSAIYSTIVAEDIQYSNPPASFGNDGQKIRTPERVLDGKLATCLDLAMLFASCLEQAGLHPVVLFKEGHAWVGVWLIDTSFPTALVDDVQAVRKRVKSGEFMVFETTGVAGGQKPSLRWACTRGEEHLNDEAEFAYAVDVRRAREVQIRPLPSRSSQVDEQAVPIAKAETPIIEDVPQLPPLDPVIIPLRDDVSPETPEGRLAKWKSKLLDLTLRNKLLNFKPTKSTLRVICPDPGALEDRLAGGNEFRVRAKPKMMSGSDGRDANVYSGRNGTAAMDDLVTDALGRNEIVTDIEEEALDGRLLDIFRTASTGMEEGGANTLFLAFGMLEWQESKDAESSHLAPILLIPVTLSRQSVRSGFRLTRHDDDALVNPTLLQKLQQDFNLKLPSLDVLPTDDRGIDVNRVLQTFRLNVGELKGWEVKEQVHLGIFSFTKYLMWKDLQDRQKQLQDNSVVSHLINNPGKAFADSAAGFEPGTLDEKFRPQDLFTPLLSDSSQLRAVCVAAEGKNLVIEGPPGTGKSQTISNLIAHLLATGKTVLFVSEKMAALEVVHRRLSSLGLGPFCLELHSSKAKKADVLKQLGVALEAAGARTVKDWERESERLLTLRTDLNGVARALHRTYPNDLTVYEAIGTSLQHPEMRPGAMPWADADVHDRTQLEALRETCRQMGALAGQLTGLQNHPLAVIHKTEWMPSWQQEFLEAVSTFESQIKKLNEIASNLLSQLGLPKVAFSLNGLAKFDVLADVLSAAPTVPVEVARSAHDESARNRLANLRQHGLARNQAWEPLSNHYVDDVATLNASELKLQWAAATNTWWPKSLLAQRAVTARLRLYRKDQRRPQGGDVPAVITALTTVNAEDKVIESMSHDASQLLHETFAASKTDWNTVESLERWATSFSDAVTAIAGNDIELAQTLRAKLQPFVSDNRSMLKADMPVGSGLLSYRDCYRDAMAQIRRVIELGQCATDLGLDPSAAGVIPRLLSLLQSWHAASRQLQPWCLWRKSRATAISSGLQGIVDALEGGDAPLSDVATFFEYSYQSWWLRKAVDREPVLCNFSSAEHDRKIAEFKEADERFQKLTQQYIAAKLAGQIPASVEVVPGADSELGKLRRELQKQRKHMPIRQLVQNLPSLMSRLKPCLLMSPLSVAQYLDASHAQFDVVIFDEASQIPVWDAVGAIARGKQLVCVGDPKQLPPTSFFSRSDDSEDGADSDDVQDLESILDECLSIGLPELRLNWHYRSKHEGLITFSNVTYYDNELVTFPSPVTNDQSVTFERVQGVYDRGGSRTNRAEADAIVKAIERHYQDPAKRHLTLGVVTFNQAQQSLIERMLDERRRTSQQLDQAIAQAAQEQLFIKNLENVQGDERDIIFFSITYGPDASGKVSLNFGPLNLEGGHRRLNVAVSRARVGVVIFSTLLPEQIDLSRVRAAGVRDLKNYLEFAIRGPRALVEQSMPTGREPDSPFERQVISALREKGWTVHPQVGVSGYRIDIGVVDPRAPGRYLMGVECDGAMYHSGATARDRDRLRQHVLEGLGWELYRIWSTDWWLNPEEPMRKLVVRLEELVETAQTEEEPVVEPPNEEESHTLYAEAQSTLEPVTSSVQLPEYGLTSLDKGNADLFYERGSTPNLARQLLKVVEVEGPISQAVAFKRVTRAWGLARVGSRIEAHLNTLVPGQITRTTDNGITFYWPAHVNPSDWEGFRVPGADAEARRSIEEIALEELGNAAVYILTQQGSTSQDGLAKAVCRLLGVARTTTEAGARISRALIHGRLRASVIVADGSVHLRR
jgi:very-short-patch-repair endonuclease